MKKKVLIVFTGAMEIGGIERSLLGLLDSFDYDKYDVDLFLYGHHGPLLPLLNNKVNLLTEVKELAYLRESFKTKLKNKCYYSAFLRVRDLIKSKFVPVDHDRTWSQIMRKCAPAQDKEYDLAISFFLPFDYIKEKAKSKIRIGWVHTDYNGDTANRDALLEEYIGMDYIAAVSDRCAESFKSIFPQLKNKVITIENILSDSFIQNQADITSVSDEMKDDGSIKLLSIGRFCEAKNFDNIPAICRMIKENGIDVKWYIIGFGGDEALIRQRIAEAGAEDFVIILGKKENPYPYIKACDIYIQPSRYEGKCVSVIEAQILGKPVIITNYATAASQLNDGIDGVIVPMDIDACADGIIKVIKNKELQEKLVENTKKTDYTNASEINKLYSIVEEC